LDCGADFHDTRMGAQAAGCVRAGGASFS
jgi:hypothetical protein